MPAVPEPAVVRDPAPGPAPGGVAEPGAGPDPATATDPAIGPDGRPRPSALELLLGRSEHARGGRHDRYDAVAAAGRERMAAVVGVEVPAMRLVVGAVVTVVGVAAWVVLGPTGSPSAPELSLPMAGAPPAAADPASGDDGAVAGGGGTTGSATPAGSGAAGQVSREVVVHAAGAVVRPGLYRLGEGARVDDLLAAAGGPAPAADTARLNLAAVLADGQRLYVPAVGEEAPPEVALDGGAGAGSAGGSGGGPGAPVVPVDLNRATAPELDVLPGIGPATAAAVVAYRDEHGPFATVDELLEVRGIGPAKLEQLRPFVTV